MIYKVICLSLRKIGVIGGSGRTTAAATVGMGSMGVGRCVAEGQVVVFRKDFVPEADSLGTGNLAAIVVAVSKKASFMVATTLEAITELVALIKGWEALTEVKVWVSTMQQEKLVKATDQVEKLV